MSGPSLVRPQPVTEQSLMESVAGTVGVQDGAGHATMFKLRDNAKNRYCLKKYEQCSGLRV